MPNLGDNCEGCGPNDLRETRVSGRTRVEVPQDYLAEHLGPPQSQLAQALAVAGELPERAAVPAFVQQPEAGVSSRGSQFTLADTDAADVLALQRDGHTLTPQSVFAETRAGLHPEYSLFLSPDAPGLLAPEPATIPGPEEDQLPATKFDVLPLLLRVIEEHLYGPDVTSGQAEKPFDQGQCILRYITLTIVRRTRLLQPDGSWRYMDATPNGALAVIRAFQGLSRRNLQQLVNDLSAISGSSTCNFLIQDANRNVISERNPDGTLNNTIDRVVLRCYRCNGGCSGTTGGLCQTINTALPGLRHLRVPAGAVDGVFCRCPVATM